MPHPTSTSNHALRAVLLAAETDDSGWSAAESLAELTRLAATAGVQVVGEVVQHLHEVHPRSYLGKGKLQELKAEKSSLRFDAVVADDELRPAQQHFIE